MTARIGAALGWAASLGVRDADDDLERLRRASLVLFVLAVIAVSPVWIATYLLLDRPLAAAIPGAYVALAVAGLAWYALTGRLAGFRASQVGAMLLLPILLQWSLGGFVNGSAVALWAFAAPVSALFFYGPRVGIAVFGAFVLAIALSGILDPALRAAVEPMPPAVILPFFILNVTAPLAAAFLLLLYFSRERERAAARSEVLLLSILPAVIARRLKRGEASIADAHPDVTILFADIVDFTPFTERTPPERVVELLNRAFSALDALADRLGLEKMKTWGDAYIVAGGLPEPRPDHAQAVAELALAMQPEIERCLGGDWPDVRLRIGIHTGPVVAGVIGSHKPSYDVWGDTVNTASRLQEHGLPGAIHVSQATAERLEAGYRIEPRGEVDLKGKRPMQTYLLLGRR